MNYINKKYVLIITLFSAGYFFDIAHASYQNISPQVLIMGMYEKYNKLDNLITYFLKIFDDLRADNIMIHELDAQDFLDIYDDMPENLQQALRRLYFGMPISEQNELIAALGCNVKVVRKVIADEMQKYSDQQEKLRSASEKHAVQSKVIMSGSGNNVADAKKREQTKKIVQFNMSQNIKRVPQTIPQIKNSKQLQDRWNSGK